MRSERETLRLDDTDRPLEPSAIRFVDVVKRFGGHAAIDQISFDVPQGQKVAVIGPSGSGKTTILRLLMTLERPDSGIIEVHGELLGFRRVDGKLAPDNEKHFRVVRGTIGMVFQHFNLFPHMTALQNVTEAPLHALRLGKDEAHRRAVDLLTMVGLSDKLNSYPRQLSGGQQQRVAIARALALRPRIMLLDEVTSALDPELVGEVLAVVRRLAREGAMTMLIVTHEMAFAREIADRVIFVSEGRIVEDTSPSIIFTHPANARTRDFLRAVLDPAGLGGHTPLSTGDNQSVGRLPGVE